MRTYDAIFYITSAVMVVSAVSAVFHPNILYAALSLLGTFFGVAVIYVLLGADFVAAAQVLIYVGGILVLILFAVMLSKDIYGVKFEAEKQKKIIPSILGLILFGFILKVIFSINWNMIAGDDAPLPTTSRLGTLLLTEYLLPFELASVLLLAALVGAMFLARRN